MGAWRKETGNQEGSPGGLAPSKLLLVGKLGCRQVEGQQEPTWGVGGGRGTARHIAARQAAAEQGHAHTRLTTSIPFNKMWKVA